MKSACIVIGFALVAIACTTTTTSPAPDPTANKQLDASAGDADKPDAATNTSSSGGTSSGDPPVSACEKETGQQACAQCCAADHKDGSTVYMDAVSTCMCEPANCATECATTLCATTPANPDAACNTCFGTKQADCGAAVTTACGASPDCVAFNQCLTDSGCATKK